MSEYRVSTGNPDVDQMIDGGFKKGKTYLVSGETGTGKTIFALQYIIEGIKRGEPGVYVTIDERSSDLVEDAENLGWNLKDYMKDKTLSMLDITPQFSKVRMDVSERDADAVTKQLIPSIMRGLSKHIHDIGAKRLVLDPIAPLIAQTENNVILKEYIRGLIFAINESLGVTTLCTSEIPTGTKKLSWYGVEEFVVSGVLVLGLERTGSNFTRLIYVRKMRGSAMDLSIYTYSIQKGRGIVVTPLTLNPKEL